MEIETVLRVALNAANTVRRSEARLGKAVVAAREAGATWAQIGEAVGMSRQSAHERWGHAPRSSGCQRLDCDCPEHRLSECPCGHGPGRGHSSRSARAALRP